MSGLSGANTQLQVTNGAILLGEPASTSTSSLTIAGGAKVGNISASDPRLIVQSGDVSVGGLGSRLSVRSLELGLSGPGPASTLAIDEGANVWVLGTVHVPALADPATRITLNGSPSTTLFRPYSADFEGLANSRLNWLQGFFGLSGNPQTLSDLGPLTVPAVDAANGLAGGTMDLCGVVRTDLRVGGTLTVGSTTTTSTRLVADDVRHRSSGTLTLLPSATLSVELGANGASDQLTATGITLDGKLEVRKTSSGMPQPGSYAILVAEDGSTVAGSFAAVVNLTSVSGLSLATRIVANTVWLDATALAGDATLDGIVAFDDLRVLAVSYGSAQKTDWVTGDFTSDERTDFNDLLVLARHYNQSVASPSNAIDDARVARAFGESFADAWAAAKAQVPEPATLASLAAAVAAACRRYRRKS